MARIVFYSDTNASNFKSELDILRLRYDDYVDSFYVYDIDPNIEALVYEYGGDILENDDD